MIESRQAEIGHVGWGWEGGVRKPWNTATCIPVLPLVLT